MRFIPGQSIGPLDADGEGELDEQYAYAGGAGIDYNLLDGLGMYYEVRAQAAIGLEGEVAPSATPAAAEVADALTDQTDYGLDTEGRILEEIDPDHNIQKWVRDAHGQVTSYTDGDGYETTYEYDYSTAGAGTLIGVDNPDGSSDDDQHDPTFHEVIAMEQPGPGGSTAVTSDAYNPDTGQLLTTTHPMGFTTSQTWVGPLLMSSTDALRNLTTYQYDADNRLTGETLVALDRTTTFDYNAQGDLIQETDPDQRKTSFLHDNDGNLTGVIDPMQRVTSTIYNALGEVVSQTVGGNRTTADDYDDDGRLIGQTEPMGRTTGYVYNMAGEVTATINPLGLMTTTLYDADGQVTGTIDPLGRITTTLYDAHGEATEAIDALGHMTTTLYDADGEVTETIDPLGRITLTFYNTDGEATETIDPLLHATTALYDADGEVTETIDPLLHITTEEEKEGHSANRRLS